jgi:hypothetical protein
LREMAPLEEVVVLAVAAEEEAESSELAAVVVAAEAVAYREREGKGGTARVSEQSSSAVEGQYLPAMPERRLKGR